jgi:hypothetical protein
LNQPNPTPPEAGAPEVATSIAEYHPVEAGLAVLREKYEGVVFDVATANGLDDARKARAEIREPRYECEKIRKCLKAPALEYSRRIDTEAARITTELEKLEIPIDDVIKREEAAAEARREQKRQAEQAQQAAYRHTVDTIASWPLSCLGSTADEIREAIAGYELTDIPSELPPHYNMEAIGAKVRALAKLREMLVAREVREAEELRLAAERRAEQERQAAEDKRLREERQRLETERRQNEARAAEERARLQREAEQAEERLANERAAMEREVAAAKSQVVVGAGLEPYPWKGPEPLEPSVPPEPIAFQAEAEAEPSDAEVLRSLAHVLEREGEPYAWVPNQLRTIAGRLEGQEAQCATVTVMRVRFEKRGGHYHCRVFTAKRIGLTFAKNGDLVFDEAEWPDIPLLMQGAEFIEEETVRP